MSYELKWEEQGLVVTFGESVDNNIYLKCNNEIVKDLRFRNIKYIIRDYSKVINFLFDSDAIRNVAIADAELYPTKPDLRVAIVSNKEVMKGLLNIFVSYFKASTQNEGWQIKYFTNIKNAEHWISKSAFICSQ